MKLGYTNDYSYLNDPGKSYDNRWMHRPVIDWEKNKKIDKEGTIEQQNFFSYPATDRFTKKIIAVGDHKNLTWLTPHNIHVAGYLRTLEEQKLYCVFNFSRSYFSLSEHGPHLSNMHLHPISCTTIGMTRIVKVALLP